MPSPGACDEASPPVSGHCSDEWLRWLHADGARSAAFARSALRDAIGTLEEQLVQLLTLREAQLKDTLRTLVSENERLRRSVPSHSRRTAPSSNTCTSAESDHEDDDDDNDDDDDDDDDDVDDDNDDERARPASRSLCTSIGSLGAPMRGASLPPPPLQAIAPGRSSLQPPSPSRSGEHTKPGSSGGNCFGTSPRASPILRCYHSERSDLGSVASFQSRESRKTHDGSVSFAADVALDKSDLRSQASMRSHESRRTTSLDNMAESSEYEILDLWKQVIDGHFGRNRPSRAAMRKTAKHDGPLHFSTSGTIFLESATMSLEKLASAPMSSRRLSWEAVGTILMLYDLVMIPLQVFPLQRGHVGFVVTCIGSLYWTIDLPWSFFVGYHDPKRGVVELKLDKIMRHYLRTWFFPDASLVVSDWILILVDVLYKAGEDDVEYLNFLKAGRWLRLLRFLRLIRLFKLHSFYNKLMESLNSEHLITLLQVLELVLLVVCINHFIACGWYGVGTLEEEESWIRVHFKPSDTFAYMYSTSLHWSFTQFTPASMEVVPTNSRERVYNVCVVIAAMLVFSSFVSAITEAMTYLRKINGKKTAQHTELRRYFGDNNVSMSVAMRVWRYLEHGAKARRQRKLWMDVEIFREIPEVLKRDLRHEVYMPILTLYPFFHQLNEVNAAAVRSICDKTVHEMSLVADQALFECGQIADRMYFVIDGSLNYIIPSEEGKRVVHVGDWVAEAAVWVRWFHSGTLVAKQFSAAIALQSSELHSVFRQYTEMLWPCGKYATLFLRHITGRREISDIGLEFDTVQTLAHEAFVEPEVDEDDQTGETGCNSGEEHDDRDLSSGGSRFSGSIRSSIRSNRSSFVDFFTGPTKARRSSRSQGPGADAGQWRTHGTIISRLSGVMRSSVSLPG
mmetsp:Transcript_59335/g.154232  ORF Transcript_59335/g.154232 Transcript_59335/m.154232 type:complete len:907 (+) Transcript_59335:87-2807(+)